MKPNKHDDMCPCTRFRAQDEFCTCGAVERTEIVADVSKAFGKRLNDILRDPSPQTNLQPFAWTWKHPNEGEEHRQYSRHHPGFPAESTYVVKPLYDHAPAPEKQMLWASFDDWWVHHLREADDITVLECVKKAFEAGRAAPPKEQTEGSE